MEALKISGDKVEKKLILFVRITLGNCPVSITASTHNKGEASFKGKSILFSQADRKKE
jgi:hypothetical protein